MFDGFQTKPLRKLGILQKLLLLKVFSPKLLKHAINIFMRKKLTDDFCGLHKNMNCAFPLTIETIVIKLNEIKLKCLKFCSLNSVAFCARKK